MLCCKAQDKCSTLFLSNEKYFSFFVLLEILNIFAPAKLQGLFYLAAIGSGCHFIAVQTIIHTL